jgi:putative methyltransferase (TIGR04325 family)
MPRTARQVIADLPGIVWLRRARYMWGLRRGRGRGLFWGAYSSYAEAIEAARAHPSRLVCGYDTAEVARAGREYYEHVYLRDYPALVWLLRFLWPRPTEMEPARQTVVDLGGHLGEQYRVFRRYWQPRADPLWVVLETAASVGLSQGLPAVDRPPGLVFTIDRASLDGSSILFASGSLQYLERDVWNLLDDVANPPPHLVLNKVPLSEGHEMWTTQNAEGKAIVPYHVMNRSRFLGELAARGYRLLDEWSVPDRAVAIPFHRDFGTSANSGLSLTRARDF